MTRVAHVLKGIASTETPSYVAFVDCESKQSAVSDNVVRHSLLFGYFEAWRIDVKRERSWLLASGFFERATDFWDSLLSCIPSKAKMYLFCHNFQFDAAMLSLDDFLSREGITSDTVIIDGTRFVLNIRVDNRTIALRDSFQYLPVPLSAIGEIVGLAKGVLPSQDASMHTWRMYCQRDVEILREGMMGFIRFVSDNDLGNFSPTLPAQALTAYRHRFMTHRLVVHDREAYLAAERAAYHGGRTECFYLGKYYGRIYCLDVNSMYPAVMASNNYPIAPISCSMGASITDLTKALERYAVIADVMLSTVNPTYPVKVNGLLSFPVGHFRTTLSTPELRFAVEHGEIDSVHAMYIYEQAPIFADYVAYFYALRLDYKRQGNKVYDTLCKLFLNSLYGKFGQRLGAWQTVENVDCPPEGVLDWYAPAENGIPRHYRRIGDTVQCREDDQEAYHSMPAIAAHVTAYARMLLYSYMLTAGRENVLYTDTDSLYVSAEGFANLESVIDAHKLGALKLEKVHNGGTFYGPKDYTLEQSTARKGIRKTAKEISQGVYEQEQFTKWLVMRSQGHSNDIDVKTIQKRLHRQYKKGNVLPDGRVIPFEIAT